MEHLFGKEFLDSLANERLLIVGVGGIGCEILKQLVVGPFQYIDIVLQILT
jgi:ubiquitin-like 1-activating enzyme E1 B